MNLPIPRDQACQPVSPFHPGEQTVQVWAGIRDKAEALGQKMLSAELVEAQRGFFAELTFAIVARIATDRLPHGQPVAELVTGLPGFITVTDDGRVRLMKKDQSTVPSTAMATQIWSAVPGMQIGILGIDLARRRRNRINGTVIENDADSVTLQIDQGYGNCPKYITKRPWNSEVFAGDYAVKKTNNITAEVAQRIDQTDTFFIASSSGLMLHESAIKAAAWGADISHRGGEPGFLEREANTLRFADYPGNNLFNTLGNLQQHPRCGMIILDFAHGDIVQISGHARLSRQTYGTDNEQFLVSVTVSDIQHWQKR